MLFSFGLLRQKSVCQLKNLPTESIKIPLRSNCLNRHFLRGFSIILYKVRIPDLGNRYTLMLSCFANDDTSIKCIFKLLNGILNSVS